MKKAPLILAIESSCDETGVALYREGEGALANEVYSQIALHREHGGVVPELAARDHIRRLPLLLEQALQRAGKALSDVDLVAYTAGPGLLGALMTGAGFARSLAYGLQKPAMAIHHMEGHLLSPLLATEAPEYPFLALLVSGGHTQLMGIKALGEYEMLGQTLDDAIGEAFDKTAKLLGLPYPGGPELAKLAERGDAKRFALPRPMTNRAGLEFSFSGLKTQVRLLIEEYAGGQSALSIDEQTRADIAASFQAAVVETVVIKCRRAWKATGYRDLVVAGGVSANQALREQLQKEAKRLKKRVSFPELSLCTDNALMIAHAAAKRFEAGLNEGDEGLEIQTYARKALG
ncbi:MAG: tRNA (adenosine(37)-N6)-threonylcarbamoyltransferase complex transferase subunit TsaD [Cardiobacteriaceae bacterium]|nr:tRNA (adenosine(37)-N6)-threonylcarbamoyltransferase complex transferase subunit TsaD [Cardiobacteriaceae bacterium]